jgi:hypothetical protein
VIVSKSDKDHSIFYCIYYSTETRKNYRLKSRIIRDEEDKVIRKRKRDTYYSKKNYL